MMEVFFHRVECFTMAREIPWHEIQKEIPIVWKSKKCDGNIQPVPDPPLFVVGGGGMEEGGTYFSFLK